MTECSYPPSMLDAGDTSIKIVESIGYLGVNIDKCFEVSIHVNWISENSVVSYTY